MEQEEKAKKKGRPAQLLKIAELRAFVDYLQAKNDRSGLQNQVIESLKAKDFNFELMSEAQQILVKETLKPYREHIKLKLLAEQLQAEKPHSAYETKFLALYEGYDKGCLEPVDLNILKTMCTRYLNFKAQKLEYSDLELYLNQLQKKEAKKKRNSENNRKFGLGGAVIAAYKELGIDIDTLTLNNVKNNIVRNHKVTKNVMKSIIFQQIESDVATFGYEWKIFFQVIDALTNVEYEGEVVAEYIQEIYSALAKIREAQ